MICRIISGCAPAFSLDLLLAAARQLENLFLFCHPLSPPSSPHTLLDSDRAYSLPLGSVLECTNSLWCIRRHNGRFSRQVEATFPNIALHHSKETTYDIDYNPLPLPQRDGTYAVSSGTAGAGNGLSGSGTSTGNGLTESGNGTASALTAGVSGNDLAGSGVNSSGANGSGAGANGTGSDSGSGLGVGGAANGQSYLGAYKTISAPSSIWESEAHAATRNVQPVQQLDFWSNVRKIEAKDDEARGGRVGNIQRSMEVAAKRATDPQMRQMAPRYVGAGVTEYPIVAAHEKLILKKNYLDLVECQHLDPDSEQQIGYNAEPQTRLPGLDLSQAHDVQSKAITHMATSEELFRGYPKFVDDKPVTYAGHIPCHPRNLAAMQGGVDCRREYPKCIMGLATHGGGVDTTVSANNIKARMRRGKNAPQVQMLKPKKEDTIRMTTEGNLLQATFHDTTERERRINCRDDKKGHLYF
eukprot:gene4155-2997_t